MDRLMRWKGEWFRLVRGRRQMWEQQKIIQVGINK